MATDYYQTLGLKRNASDDEIQKAYRQLALKHHPDLNPEDESAKKKFQEIQSAFDVLSDEKKRAMYDRYGSNFEAVGAGPGGATHTWSGPGPGAPGQFEFDLNDLFGGHAPDMGGAGQIIGLIGSSIPFPATKEQREANHDPRTSIQERYASKEDYLAQVRRAAQELVDQRYLLAEDVTRVEEQAAQRYDLFSQGGVEAQVLEQTPAGDG